MGLHKSKHSKPSPGSSDYGHQFNILNWPKMRRGSVSVGEAAHTGQIGAINRPDARRPMIGSMSSKDKHTYTHTHTREREGEGETSSVYRNMWRWLIDRHVEKAMRRKPGYFYWTVPSPLSDGS